MAGGPPRPRLPGGPGQPAQRPASDLHLGSRPPADNTTQQGSNTATQEGNSTEKDAAARRAEAVRLLNLATAADEQVRTESTPEAEAEDYDETRDAVRIEYEEGKKTVGFWLVPERYKGATYENEPALRRSELAAMLEKGEGAGVLRENLTVLRAFPGARIRGAAVLGRP